MTNNLFSNLNVVSGEVKVETLKENFALEVSGTFKMTKGNFEQQFTYWGRMYKTNYHNYIGIEDLNVDEENCNIGGLPIDNLSQLKKTLTDSGLKTLSDSLGFSYKEHNNGAYQTIQKHKDFIKSYGKKAIVWNLLSVEEQKIVKVKHAIDNYDTCPDHYKLHLGIISYDEAGVSIPNYIPAIEELKELYNQLNK